MICSTDPERFGPDLVVHRFDAAALVCRCGAVVVKSKDEKPAFNQQVYGKIGRPKGQSRRKPRVKRTPV